MELSISISYVPTSASISKSVIISSSSPNLTGWLCALYRLAANIIFAALSLILNCPGLELTVDVYRGLPTGRPLPCVPCNPYIPYNPYVPIQSGNIIIIHCLTSDSDPCWAHADYSLYTCGEKTLFEKTPWSVSPPFRARLRVACESLVVLYYLTFWPP